MRAGRPVHVKPLSAAAGARPQILRLGNVLDYRPPKGVYVEEIASASDSN